MCCAFFSHLFLLLFSVPLFRSALNKHNFCAALHRLALSSSLLLIVGSRRGHSQAHTVSSREESKSHECSENVRKKYLNAMKKEKLSSADFSSLLLLFSVCYMFRIYSSSSRTVSAHRAKLGRTKYCSDYICSRASSFNVDEDHLARFE